MIMNIKTINIKKLIVPILLICLSVIVTTYKLNMYGKKISLLFNFLIIIIELLVFFLLRKTKIKEIKLHKLYLVIAIVLGAFYIIAFPPSEIPDETSDYLRSLEISKFQLVTKLKDKKAGDYYSKNVTKVMSIENYKDEIKNRKLKLNGKKEFINYANKALYSFICYIPQSIGVGIGVALKLPIVFQIILGKIFNYALFVLLTYFSIKYIPYKKSLVFFIALLPITIQEATSLSPDSLAIVLSLFLIAYILKLRTDKKEITTKQMTILSITTIVVSLCKIVYLPLCLLILLIPKKQYKTKKTYLCFNILLISAAIALNLIWLKYSSRYLITFTRTNSSEQLKYILDDPIRYLVLIVHTIDMFLPEWILQVVGQQLGTLRIRTSILVLVPAVCILIKLIMGEKTKIKHEFNNKEKSFITLIILSIVFLTFTSLYIQWTYPQTDYVMGVQGRYFIPLLVPLSCIFMIRKKEDGFKYSLIEFAIIQNIMALLFIIEEFI